ncbi:hypothetical protein D910_08744 [Dendroctonus ponderosae]|uniref:Reverse transcriptase domain-containing protein n=1 Tax=Dendroctonus ponderosae TaxID=77166 RepID=U4UEE6_DENPD|nr:hypothetical protein D910_08744 [Dendroctonus ponderosae]
MFQTNDPDFEEEVKHNLREIRHRQIPPDCPQIPPVTLTELKTQISSLKIRKAPGPYQITNKILKHLPESPLNQILTLIIASVSLREFPTSWKTAFIILIPKPTKNKTFPQNWRPISLLSTLSKVTERLFLERLNDLLSQNQTISRD